MKRRVLMTAYAFDPKGIGEYWLGWGWAEQAAKVYDVEVIAPARFQEAVRERAAACGLKVHFVGLHKKLASKGEGNAWGAQWNWQYRAAALAKKLHREKPFDIVHQTTFHSFRVPFVSSYLGIPSVWGPIAGGESIPPGFMGYVGKGRRSETIRQLVNRLWLYFPPIRRSLRCASAIFVSNSTTLRFLPADIQKKCRVVPPNALRPEDESYLPPEKKPRPAGAPLYLLYIGYCVPTRSLPLVLEALAKSGLTNYKLTVLGVGPSLEDWKRQATELGLSQHVEFLGKIPHAQLLPYYETADALVFPGLRDSGGSSLLESMARNLPVICLDWAGPGEMVDAASGFKIAVDTPEKTVKAMGEAFKRFEREPGLGASMAVTARKRALEVFRWDYKLRILTETYERLLKGI